MQESMQFLKSKIKKNTTVVVACSGGPDSMCLLSLLCDLKNKVDFKIIVAHVNHKIRLESDDEAIMVRDYCQRQNVIFELRELNEFKNGEWTEELARKKRYEFFNELMIKYRAKYLITAHHGDDLIETVLMRITRGSTLSGYLGIKLVNNKILRPLLYVSKSEILEYLDKKSIPYAIDKSNESLEMTRNRYRHNILPFLKEEDKNVHKKYLKFSQELSEYEEFVNEYIKNNNFIVDNYIDINNIKMESNFIKRKTIELLIKNIQSVDILNISDKNMQDILLLINSSNKSIDLNNNYQAINSYGKLFITKKDDAEFDSIIFNKDIDTKYFKFYYNIKDGDNSNNTIYLASNEITLPIILRKKANGDVMEVKNLGKKKVSDIFINSKIPKYKRDNYPILVDSEGRILWIPGVKKSKFAKDKSEKYDIIVRCEAR